MKEAKTFYYRFDKINAWFVFNAALLITMLYVSIKCYCLLFWWHNGDITPFSIPLYEIVSPEDAAELTEIIAEKVKLTRLPQA